MFVYYIIQPIMKNKLLFKYICCLLLTIAFSILYFKLYGEPQTGIDDADIYFIYVKNFVEGHGFVYNIGGEKVEGFTSLLWVLLLSPIYILAENFEKTVLILNVIIMSFAIFRAVQFLDTIIGSKRFISVQSTFLLIYIYIIPGFIDWTVLTLMESSLWCFLLTMTVVDLGYYIFHQDKKRFILINIYIFLLVFTRPESLLWGMFFVTMLSFIQIYNLKQTRISFKYTLGILSFFCLAIVILISFRLLYFGYPLPNTYYAKVSSDVVSNIFNGIYYFILSTWQSPFLWLFLISSIIALLTILLPLIHNKENIFKFSPIQILQLLFSSTALISILIPIYLGGDHFELLRFFQPFVLVYLLCLLNTPFWKAYFGELNFKIKRLSSGYILVVLLFPFLYFSTKTPLHYIRNGRSPIFGQFKIAAIGRKEGRTLNKFFNRLNKKPSIGVSAAGGFAYTYQGSTIDLLGLNNTQMAHASDIKKGIKNHAAFDFMTFYEIAPDIFHGYSHGSKVLSVFLTSPYVITLDVDSPDFEESFVNRLFKGIFATEEYKTNYKPVIIYNPDIPDFYYQTFVHINYLSILEEHGYEIKILERE